MARHRGNVQTAAVLGQGPQERRAHAQSTALGQDAWSDEPCPGGLGPVGETAAHHVAVLDGDEQQSVRRVVCAQLLEAVGARPRLDGEPDSPPRLVLVVGDADGQLHTAM